MVIEIIAIILAVISIALAIFTIVFGIKTNKETSEFLIQIKTFSENINERSMSWLEQLIFSDRRENRDTVDEKTKSKKDVKTRKPNESDMLNLLFVLKGANFQEILDQMENDYASVKLLIRKLNALRVIRNYTSEQGETIYYLSETKEEALKKYPENKVEGIPF